MDKYTFGNSQSAVNLMTNILGNPEYEKYSKSVAHLLSKQFKALIAITEICDKEVRETTLQLWHDRFKELTEDLPEVVKTHTRCVETGKFRQMLKGDDSKE